MTMKEESVKNVEPKRTKVEYVKVVDSIFHLQPELLAGELYSDYDERHYIKIENEAMLISAIEEGVLYRKVETEIKTEKRWLLYDSKGNFCSEHDSYWYYLPRDSTMQMIEITVEV